MSAPQKAVRISFVQMARGMIARLYGPVLLSTVGPVYFGHFHRPYTQVIAWMLASTIVMLRLSLRTFDSWFRERTHFSAAASVATTIAVTALVFVVADNVAYFVARAIS